MNKIRTIIVALAVILLFWSITPHGPRYRTQEKKATQENFFEMSLEELMEVKVTLVSDEKEESPLSLLWVKLLDPKV
ncbi:MAG: hypothetical protein ACYS8Y_07080 [Planctomycetota bacterium]|jgi:hypothetical protein